MSTTIQVIPDSKTSGSEELIIDINEEFSALGFGNIKKITEKSKAGTLHGLDLTTIGIIISGAKLTLDLTKAFIGIIKEIRLRYADKKKIDLDNVPKITLKVEDEEGNKEPLELEIPSSKVAENRFIEQATSKKDETI